MTAGRLGPYLWAARGPFGLAAAAMALLALSSAAFAGLIGPAIAALFSAPPANSWPVPSVPSAPQTWLRQLAAPTPAQLPALLLTNAVIKGAAQALQFYALGLASLRIQGALRRDAFAHLLAQSPRFFVRRPSGDLLARLTSDAQAVEHALFYGLGSLVRDGLSLLALFGFCAWTQPRLTASTLVAGPLAALCLKRFGRFYKAVLVRGRAQFGALSAHLFEVFGGVWEVQHCQREAHEAARLAALDAGWMATAKDSYRVRAVRTPAMEILATALLAALLWAFVAHGGADAARAAPAGYLSFVTALLLMYDPLKKLGQVADHLAAGRVAADRLFELMAPREGPNDRGAAGVALARAKGAVVLERVRFAYDERPVLEAASLHIEAGETVAVAGASGAGKSTLVKLLLRHYDVAAGHIALDGHDLRALSLSTLRRQFAVVSQEPFLFGASAADNIAYGRPGASRREVLAAAEAAQALEFLRALPEGLDTPLGERGTRLSGGQKQRIAIARAILRDAPVLILDEATSQLDTDNEQAVDDALAALARSRTTLVISHRPSTLARADRVVVLEHGRFRPAHGRPSFRAPAAGAQAWAE